MKFVCFCHFSLLFSTLTCILMNYRKYVFSDIHVIFYLLLLQFFFTFLYVTCTLKINVYRLENQILIIQNKFVNIIVETDCSFRHLITI